MSGGYVDSDGHVIESEAEINEFLVEPYAGGGYRSFHRVRAEHADLSWRSTI